MEQLKEKENKIKTLQNRVEELQKAGLEKKDACVSAVNVSFLLGLRGYVGCYFVGYGLNIIIALVWLKSAVKRISYFLELKTLIDYINSSPARSLFYTAMLW